MTQVSKNVQNSKLLRSIIKEKKIDLLEEFKKNAKKTFVSLNLMKKNGMNPITIGKGVYIRK